jgi:hypothetical protein
LIIKPFLGNKAGPTRNEVLSRAVEHGADQPMAALPTQISDAGLEGAVERSQGNCAQVQ